MKLHYVLFLAVIVLLSGCSTTKSYVLSYEQSAALAIEKAIIDMNLPEAFRHGINLRHDHFWLDRRSNDFRR